MRLHLLVLSAICSASACTLQPPSDGWRSSARDTVRVATWNVHDLFDPVDRSSPPGELDEVPTAAEVEAKLLAVAAVLSRLDADVLLLQEVENLPLAQALASAAGYGAARLVDGFDPRGIDVAVLSRLPVDDYVSHLGELGPDGRPLWSRDCVEASVGGLVVVGTHLVSLVTDPDGDRRHAQAARTREIADAAAAAGVLVVAGGDLNDHPDGYALQPLLADGSWVDALAAFGLGEAWTWVGGGGGSRLDYLLVPAAEAWRVTAVEVVDGPDVAAASDHRPVVVELRWGI
jgi:endonuclease/exonuclease/phosphatase family metal-dependent hydrolase